MNVRTVPRLPALILAATACAGPEPPAPRAPVDVPTDAPTEAPTDAPTETLRVVDINVWSGLDYQGTLAMGEYEPDTVREARYRALLAQLRALDPDIIGVHEANPVPGYVDRLAADLGFDAVRHMGLGGIRIGPVGLPWNLREGDAILARPSLELRDEGRRKLSGGYVGAVFAFHFTDATQVLAASIRVNGRRLPVFATHWHAGDAPADSAWRAEESRRTLAFVREIADHGPALLIGDFNATVQAPEVRRLLDAGFVDAHGAARGDAARPTWDPARNRNIREHYLGLEPGDAPHLAALPDSLAADAVARPRRIDLILVRRSPELELRIRDTRVVLDSVVGGVHASDHFGVMAELQPSTHPHDR